MGGGVPTMRIERPTAGAARRRRLLSRERRSFSRPPSFHSRCGLRREADSRYDARELKKLLSLALLMGVLLGLFAQEAAFAAAPVAGDASGPVAAQHCMDRMQQDRSDGGQVPCDCSDPGCIAMMGGALSLDQPGAPVFSSVPDFTNPAHDRKSIHALSGRVTGPEPEPPIYLI